MLVHSAFSVSHNLKNTGLEVGRFINADDTDILEVQGFSFDSKKTNEGGKIPGGVLTESYEEILNKYPKWKEISSKVIELIYK